MKLRRGTYIRERDGATLVYYSELSTYNFPEAALNNWKDCRTDGTTRLNTWERITDEGELTKLREFLGGNLKPGEYVEVNSFDNVHVENSKIIVDETVTIDPTRCQFFIMVPEHYRPDGSCKCDDPEHQEFMIKEWEYSREDFK